MSLDLRREDVLHGGKREFPEARVVRALNTVNCEVMINSARIPGDHAFRYVETTRKPKRKWPRISARGLDGSHRTLWISAISAEPAVRR